MDPIEIEIKKEFEKRVDNNHWFSLDIPANHFQLQEVLSFLGDAANKKVLDIGCGKGRFAKRIAEAGAIVSGIDIVEQLVESAKKNVPNADFFIGSATQLPFPDNYFDFVYSIETFEHIPNSEKAIQEIYRVLKKEGKVIVIDKSLYSIHPIFNVPTFIYKWLMEKRGKWMYSPDFQFKEKYFTLVELDQIFARYFHQGWSQKISKYGKGLKTEKIIKKYPFLQLKFVFTDFIYKIFPSTRFFITWKWQK